MKAQPTPVPMVFRFAAALLLAAAIVGGWWQRQPAGGATRLLMGALARRCPAVIQETGSPTIATGAHTGDRVVLALLLDRLAPTRTSRCTGQLNKTTQARR